MNNMAYNYGGAIACERSQSENPLVSIKKSKFINCYSINDAGGGVYLKSTQFTGDKLNFTSCCANFGGALTLLSSDSYLSDIYGFNNTARYDGGVIYGMFKNLTIVNSNFTCNNAKNGAVFFISNIDYHKIEKFIKPFSVSIIVLNLLPFTPLGKTRADEMLTNAGAGSVNLNWINLDNFPLESQMRKQLYENGINVKERIFVWCSPFICSNKFYFGYVFVLMF